MVARRLKICQAKEKKKEKKDIKKKEEKRGEGKTDVEEGLIAGVSLWL